MVNLCLLKIHIRHEAKRYDQKYDCAPGESFTTDFANMVLFLFVNLLIVTPPFSCVHKHLSAQLTSVFRLAVGQNMRRERVKIDLT